MFDKLVRSSYWMRKYTIGPFFEERRNFLSCLHGRGHSLRRLRTINKFLLGIAERVDLRQTKPITNAQLVRAAEDWAKTRCEPSSSHETHRLAKREFFFIARKWLRFLDKWNEPDLHPHFKEEIGAFIRHLREDRGYTDQTLLTRQRALHLFFDWLAARRVSLATTSPTTIAAYFVEHKARSWKKATIVAYVQSLRAFFRFAGQRGWCAKGLAETIARPPIYSMAALPEGPTWEQVQRLIAHLNTNRPGHIRDRAMILLLAIYGLRMGEVCRLTLDDLDWLNEKIRVRRLKNKRVQEYPLPAEVGNAILKYIRAVRPRCSARALFLTLHTPHRPMTSKSGSGCIQLRMRALRCPWPHYGPHALRHSCATHLLAQGFSLKEIGDHLGHRSARSAQIYAKVDQNKLGQVAALDLSDFAPYIRKRRQQMTQRWAADRLPGLREVASFRLGGLL